MASVSTFLVHTSNFQLRTLGLPSWSDRCGADDDAIPAMRLREHVGPFRRTCVAADVAALVVHRQSDKAEGLARILALQPPHVLVGHAQRLTLNRHARVVDPEPRQAV